MLNVPRDLALFELGEPQHLNVSVKPSPRKAFAKVGKAATLSPYDKVRRKVKVFDGPSGPMLQDGPSGPMFQDGPSGPLSGIY